MLAQVPLHIVVWIGLVLDPGLQVAQLLESTLEACLQSLPHLLELLDHLDLHCGLASNASTAAGPLLLHWLPCNLQTERQTDRQTDRQAGRYKKYNKGIKIYEKYIKSYNKL